MTKNEITHDSLRNIHVSGSVVSNRRHACMNDGNINVARKKSESKSQITRKKRKRKEGLNPQAMKLIPYRTGHFFRTVELTGIQTPLDSYCSKYWSILDSFGHTGENWMFWPVNLNRANTKKKNPKIINFCHYSHSPPRRRSLPCLQPLPFCQLHFPHLLQLLLPRLFTSQFSVFLQLFSFFVLWFF